MTTFAWATTALGLGIVALPLLLAPCLLVRGGGSGGAAATTAALVSPVGGRAPPPPPPTASLDASADDLEPRAAGGIGDLRAHLLTFASTSSLGSHCVTPLATPGHSRNSSVTSAAGGDAGPAAPAGGALQRDLSRVTEESVSPFLGQD